ncbi:MAG: hypothetical protein RL307_233, partial [Pseudomonadota bacterium]
MKKFNPLSFLFSGSKQPAADSLPAAMSQLQSWLDDGLRVVRSGDDALLVHPDGSIERIENFFLDAVAALNQMGAS